LEEVPVRKTLSGLLAIGLMLGLAACGSEPEATGVKANMGATVGISMPNETSTRWIGDGKSMVDQFTAMGYKVELTYAKDDVPTQVAQVKKMVDRGDKLLVISAVDGASMTDVLAQAAKKGVKVIAYDRLLTKTKDVDYQATFDNIRVGEMQAQLLVDRLGLANDAKGPFNVELFAGSSTDANALSFYKGSMKILKPYIDDGKIVVRSGETKFLQVTTDKYSAEKAQARMRELLTKYYRTTRVHAVLSPYDGMTIGIIKGLKSRGYGRTGKPLPITSGQDAEVASMQSIEADEQTGTIYKDTRELAKVAVQMGNALLTGSKPIVNDTSTYNNEVKIVPTYHLYPVAVDKSNYRTLLIDGGYYTEAALQAKLPEQES
jgi:putative multiple sugar transport system substrate-binding protein